MKILLLSPYPEKIFETVSQFGDEVTIYNDKIDSTSAISKAHWDFWISFGYRFKINSTLIETFKHKIINLHISYLPWNAGCDPNFWSFYEGTPKGVTIHWIDKGIDTGDIIVQEKVAMENSDTLLTSYNRLQTAVVSLFNDHWPKIRSGKSPSSQQQTGGTYHRSQEAKPHFGRLPLGWDTPVSEVEAMGLQAKKLIA